jgi:hypothetical protein
MDTWQAGAPLPENYTGVVDAIMEITAPLFNNTPLFTAVKQEIRDSLLDAAWAIVCQQKAGREKLQC